MDSFEYLITLVSVIAGLGITRTLSGLARLFDYRHQIIFSWITIAWTINVLLWLVAFWWFTFLLSSLDGWSPWLHVFVLVYAGVIFFMLALLHPESIDGEFDMFGRFISNRKMFFGVLMATAIIDVIDTLIKGHMGLPTPPLTTYSAFILSWIVISGIALFAKNRAVHGACSMLFLVVMAVWMSQMIAGLMDSVAKV